MQGMDKAAVYIQAQLGRVGVKMDIATLELEAARNRVKAGAFEAATFVIFSNLDGPGLFLDCECAEFWRNLQNKCQNSLPRQDALPMQVCAIPARGI